MSSDTQLKITRRTETNQYYDEVLAEDVLPLRMMQIPAGTFLMGSPEDELERRDSEGPQREVTVSQFFMANYPITQAQWRVVATMPQVNRALGSEPSKFNGDMRPVEQVSWYEAVEFCNRLTVYTDRQYRLPTEAEWEYACRANTRTPFSFGPTISTDYANYCGVDETIGENSYSGSYGHGSKGEHRRETTPVVDFKIANAFGLHDMHGNVWEWCQDYWHENYEGAPCDGSAWLKDGNSARRVRRGGSWFSSPEFCRSAYRFNLSPDSRSSHVGFRLACSSAASQSSVQDKPNEFRPEELQSLLRLACEEGFQDRAIAQGLQVSESEIHNYWLLLYERLGINVDAEKQAGRNVRATTCLRAREKGWLD